MFDKIVPEEIPDQVQGIAVTKMQEVPVMIKGEALDPLRTTKAARLWFLLEEQAIHTFLLKMPGGTEPGKARTDHDDPLFHPQPSTPFIRLATRRLKRTATISTISASWFETPLIKKPQTTKKMEIPNISNKVIRLECPCLKYLSPK